MRIPLFFILFVAAVSGASGQERCNLSLSGTVLDTEGTLLRGATVHFGTRGTTTNDKGEFRFSSLCPGSELLHVRYVGYEEYVININLTQNQRLDLQLTASVTELETVQIFGQSSPSNVSNTTLSMSETDLNQLRGKSLGEGLKALPGVNVVQSGPAVFKPMIHGLYGQRLLILNNGIRQEGQQWGIEHAPEIDAFIASDISVVKGAETVRYGADALGGVIIVNTTPLHKSQEFGGEFNTGYMTNNRMGIFSGVFEGGLFNTGHWNWRLQGTVKKGGDFSTPGYVLSNTGLEELNFSAALGFKDSRRGLEIYGSSFNTEIGILRAAHTGNLDDLEQSIKNEEPWYIMPFTYSIDNPKQEVNHQLIKVKAHQNITGVGTLNLMYGGQFNQRREYDVRRAGRSARPSLFMKLFSNVLDVSLDHERAAHSGSLGLNITYKYNQNDTNETGRNPLVPDYHQFSTGFFFIEKVKRDRWLFEAGGRYDYQYLNVLTFDNANNLIKPAFHFHYFSGSLGGTYSLQSSARFISNISMSSRPPHVSELYSNGLHHGSAAIEEGLMINDSEILTDKALVNKEVSTKWINTLQVGTKSFSADLSLYVNTIANYIFLRPVGTRETISGYFPVWQYEQTNALLTGADVLFTWSVLPRIDISGKYAYIYAKDIGHDDHLLFIPPSTGEGSVTYRTHAGKFSDIYFRMSLAATGKQHNAPITVYPSEIPNYDGNQIYDIAPAPQGYLLVSAEAGFKVPLFEHDLSISLTGENLTNQVYRNYLNRLRYFADEIGRNFIIRLKYTFHAHN